MNVTFYFCIYITFSFCKGNLFFPPKVNVSTYRGGLLRWLWGVGGGARVAIVAAYNGDAHSVTLTPLPPSPQTPAQLEGRIDLLPTQREAESGVYGGEYCLECVINKSIKVGINDNICIIIYLF